VPFRWSAATWVKLGYVIDVTPTALVGTTPSVRAHHRVVGEPRTSAPAAVETRSPRQWWDPLWCGLLAFAVAAAGSWIPSKWNDEAATQTAATRTLPQLWQMMQHIDAVHGTYYAFMHFWILVFGTSNFALRAPSMLAVGIACAGVVVLGRRLGGRRVAICAGLVFLLLPRVTWMGIEARSSAMTAAVAVWLTIVLLRAVDRRTTVWWAVYTAVATAGVLLNLYIALLVIAHGVTLVLARRRLTRPGRLLLGWGIGAAVAAALSFPVERLALAQSSQLPFGPLTLTGTSNGVFFAQYFSGATPTVGRGIPFPPTSLWSTAVIVVAVFGWLLVVAPIIWRRLRPVPSDRSPLQALGILVPWIVLPTAVVLAYSLVATPIYTPRYFAFTTPAVALLMGATIAALGRAWMRVTALVLLAVLVLPIYVSQRQPTSKNGTDWQQAAAIIQAHAKPGQDIYYGPARKGVTVSMEKMAAAYPAVLSSLHNISLRESALQLAQLWGRNWPLTHVRAELRTTPALWAVIEHRNVPSPLSTKQERYIEAQGLHLTRIWRGSMTDVLYYTR
jgi:mannosyltransferase